MHTIWKGAIGFGLVHIPVKLYAATEEKEISLQLLHKGCHGTVKTQRYCSSCEKKLSSEDLIKGYKLDNNKFLIFEKEELEQLHDDSKKINIIQFIKEISVDLMFTQKVYYLGPEDGYTDAYSLFIKALEVSKRVAVAKITIRSSTKLCILKPINGSFIQLSTMYYPNEIRTSERIPNLPSEAQIDSDQLQLAQQLIKNLSSSKTEESQFTNVGQVRMQSLIQSKISGKEVIQLDSEKNDSHHIIDLMEAIKMSINLFSNPSTKKNKQKKKESAS
jgi:DNA end-binding protein Ku